MSERVSTKSLERCMSRIVNELADRRGPPVLRFSKYLVIPAGTQLTPIDNASDRVTLVDSHVTGLISTPGACYVHFLETRIPTSFNMLPSDAHLKLFSEEFTQKLLMKIHEIRRSRKNS